MQRRTHGTCDTAFTPVRDAMEQVLAADPDEGCAVHVVVDGRPVVDLWGGSAGAGRDFGPDTLVHGWSAVKPVAALPLLRLVDAGRVELDAPVATYWPEYAAHGKAGTTVRHLLAHASGLVAVREPMTVEELCDWDATVRRLQGETPFFEPGQGVGEQALHYGHLVGEVARRVDGRSLGRQLREDVCGPLGLDVHVGVPAAEQVRCADLANLTRQWASDLAAGRGDVYRQALGNPPGLLDSSAVNTADWRSAEVPAVGGQESARGLAGFYAAALFKPGALLTPDLLDEATRVQASGVDVVLEQDAQWGLGFSVEDEPGETGFGMGGIGGSSGWADTGRGYAIAFVTRLMGGHDRGDLVDKAVRSCV